MITILQRKDRFVFLLEAELEWLGEILAEVKQVQEGFAFELLGIYQQKKRVYLDYGSWDRWGLGDN